jgi:hypothetical protein
MRTANNLLFFIALVGLYFLTIGLSYFRPSHYLPQKIELHKEKTVESKNDSLQIAEKKQEIVKNNIQETDPETGVKTLPESKKKSENEQEIIPKEKAKSTPFSAYLKYIFLGIILTIVGFLLWQLCRILDKRAQKDLEKLPIGIPNRKYNISPNFQKTLLDRNLKKELYLPESALENYRPEKRGFNKNELPSKKLNIASSAKDIKEQGFSAVFAHSSEANQSSATIGEKLVLSVLRFYSPKLIKAVDFRLKLRWADFWALTTAFQAAILSTFFSIQIIGIPVLFITLLFTSGLYRLNKICYWAGVVFNILGAISWAVYVIYKYSEQFPVDKIEFNFVWKPMYLYGLIFSVLAIYLFRIGVKSKFAEFTKKRFNENAIWLKDINFLVSAIIQLAVILAILAFFILKFLFIVLMVSIVCNLVLWLISPLESADDRNKWLLKGSHLFYIAAATTLFSLFSIYSGNLFGLTQILILPIAINTSIIFYFFPILNNSNKKEPNKTKTVETAKIIEKPVKELQKIKLKTPKNIPKKSKNKEIWWKSNPETLGMLNLSNQNLQESDESIKYLIKCKNLKHIYLNNNNLNYFPEEIFMLKELREIDLSNNHIKSFPTNLAQLSQLTILELAGNEIQTIPSWITELSALKILNLKGNPILKTQIEKIRKEAPHISIEF